MTAQETGRVIFTGTHDWYEIVARDEEIETGEAFEGDWERAASVAGVNIDDAESWVCLVTTVAARHTAIHVGDYACCDGYGCDVIFVRL